jgi:hypothetical protein
VPATGGALPCLCMLIHKGLTFPASAFLAMLASLKGLTFLEHAGELSSTDGTPSNSYRSLLCSLGAFKGLVQQTSVVYHLVAAPSPCGKSGSF